MEDVVAVYPSAYGFDVQNFAEGADFFVVIPALNAEAEGFACGR